MSTISEMVRSLPVASLMDLDDDPPPAAGEELLPVLPLLRAPPMRAPSTELTSIVSTMHTARAPLVTYLGSRAGLL